MTECDAFKLIEEFIKKSSSSPKQNDLLLPTTLLTLQSSPSSFSSNNSELSFNSNAKPHIVNLLVETPPESPEQPKHITLPNELDQTTNQKPNRPYSYYVATNFHPLDLSLLSSSDGSNECTTNELTVLNDSSNDTKPVETTINYHKNVVCERGRKKKPKSEDTKKSDKQKRLSMSLTDIKTTPNNHKTQKSMFKFGSRKSKSNQNNLCQHSEYDQEDLDNVNKSSFKRSTFFTSTMPARVSNKTLNKPAQTQQSCAPGAHTPGRINRFFRLLFRLNNNNNNDEKSKIKNENTIIENEAEEDDSKNFKFSRIFSFRSNSVSSEHSLNRSVKYKYSIATQLSTRETISTSNRTNSTSTNSTSGPNFQLIVSDEQPSKVLLPHINLSEGSERSDSPTSSYNKIQSLDNLEILKDKFYSEVADRLKKLASNSSCAPSSVSSEHEHENENENEKSSLSSIDLIDIPYIDDEEECEQTVYSYGNSPSSYYNLSTKLKTDMTDVAIDPIKLSEFISNASYERFDELAVDYLNKYDSIWNKIAILFELINRAVQMVSTDHGYLRLKLKEIAANYIHDKYCDWIYQHGGWKSVPDIISLRSENNERMH